MLKNMFIFVTGALAGTVIGARLVKKRYEEIANEEIEEIRAYYKEKEEQQKVRSGKIEEKVETNNEEITEEAMEESRKYYKSEESKDAKEKYGYIIDNFNYSTETIESDKEDDPYEIDFNDPYPIDPSEFGNEGHYGTERYTYFADGVIVDDDDEVVEEWEDIVGRHHIEVFEEFPNATSVYIRNDRDGIDYEIIKDDWCWSDIQEPEKKPHQL